MIDYDSQGSCVHQCTRSADADDGGIDARNGLRPAKGANGRCAADARAVHEDSGRSSSGPQPSCVAIFYDMMTTNGERRVLLQQVTR